MKTAFYVAVLLELIINFGTLTKVNAQNFNAGILLGNNISKMDGVVNEGYFVFGFQSGIYASLKIDKNKFGRIEIKHIVKGNNSKPNYSKDYNVRLNYIEIPLLMGFTLPKTILNLKLPKNIYSLCGISAGKLIKTKEKDLKHFLLPINQDPFNEYEVAGHLGLGWNFLKHFTFETRFSRSLTPIRKSTNSSPYLLGNQYNNNIGWLIAYTF